MPRPRITEEQAIERYGSLENYESHLAQMIKWHRDHAEEQKDYRWKNRDRERSRAKKWREEHPEQVAQIKARHKERRHTDKRFAESLNIRTRSRYLADKLGIDRTGCELHHYTDPITLGNFIVLSREKHRFLHNNFGGSNKRIDLKVIKAVLPMLGNVVLVKDGKITDFEEVQ
jgi:hypothetical protein